MHSSELILRIHNHSPDYWQGFWSLVISAVYWLTVLEQLTDRV